MLTELRIDQFAIIQHLELEFAPGLVTFTGETGAGKSIILDAIEAVVGGRTEPGMVRSGAEKAMIEATFSLPEASRATIVELLQREELLDEPDFVTLSREIRREGRTVARINGHAANLALVRELGAYLVDIHGQSEHLSLLNVRQHLGLLDRFANSAERLSEYRKVYDQLHAVRRELDALRRSELDAERRKDLLEYQLSEIDGARLVPGEEPELRMERDRLANAENLASLAQQTLLALDEGDPESPAASDLWGQVVQALTSLARIDTSQVTLMEQAETIANLMADLSHDLHNYQDAIEFNPRRLEQIEDRLDLLRKLQKKYGGSIESALAFAEKTRHELDGIEHASERIAELEQQESILLGKLSQVGKALSAHRQAAAAKMQAGVERELNDLSMAGARFAVDFRHPADEAGVELEPGQRVAFDASGLDRVEFLIAPNPGEGLSPLVKIASGGETSRLMLALKNVLAQADSIPTLIFDEIDQGISGRVGTMVGEKLWQLGRQHQVLCVTHLPQLAAFGDLHYSVRKLVTDGRTLTQVQSLKDEARRDELAQMLGTLNEPNRQAAQETLRSARRRADELLKVIVS